MSSVFCGIVGLPNVGKSTLFNALTNNNVLAANYPFATIEPNTGVVPVPDERLVKLAEIYKTNKIVPATVTFVDIAGLVAGASQGEGLGNRFLSHIRSVNAIIHVVRAFADPNATNFEDQANPKKDIDIINTELVLADLQTIEKRLPQLEKEAKANPNLKSEVDFLESIKKVLNSGIPLSKDPEIMDHKLGDWLHQELQLLTLKPVIYVFNVGEDTLQNQEHQTELSKIVAPAKPLFICAKLEDELHGLDKLDASELLASYGQKEFGLSQLIKAAYDLLGLQSFLTAGEKEVRAWTIAKDTLAPQAAGTIHGDFERGFIAAEVVAYNDLITAGSLATAKAAGQVRTEGKDYTMRPDDIVEFRFNV